MKKITIAIASLVFAIGLVSCDKPATENTTPEIVTNDETVSNETPTNETVGNPADVKTDAGPFQLDPLKYGYADLSKSIDPKTMEVHYSKHYLTYANKLNAAIKGTANESKSIEEIMKGMDLKNSELRNNGGGYYNHKLYFASMSPNGGGQPTGALADAIKKDFGSFDALKTKLSEAAAKRFGSGWAWLTVKDGKLMVGSTANQDNPLMPGQEISGTPILGIDVWEHAYYLKYQNKRPEYIDAFFNVVDWNFIGQNYDKAIASK